MLILSILVTLCASAAGETCSNSPSCSLFPNMERGEVSLQDVTQKIQSKHWIMIYYTDFTAIKSYGKCYFRWNAPDTDQNVKKELMCYNIDWKGCEDFGRTVKRKVTDCKRVEENNVLNETMVGRFYSQDLDKYLWYYTCYQYDEADKCTLEYFDLLVSKTRSPESDGSELDLQGLPWHLIVSDLKIHFNMDMSDVRMNFAWNGPECGFDGSVIETSSASIGQMNIVALFVFIVIH